MRIITEVALLKNRRTKIIATLGPASNTPGTIKRLVEAGTNVFRLNMSHGTQASHEQAYQLIRNIADKPGKPVAVLADLCGPKLRTGQFEGGQIMLENKTRVTVTTRNVIGQPGLIPAQYQGLPEDLRVGNRILLNDGNQELKVERVAGTEIACIVVHGGHLKNNTGINLPGVNISAPSMTEKDREDARFALALGVDFLALSYVRRAEDIDDLRAVIKEMNVHAGIIAKIEKLEALTEANAILDVADGIMIARGDLGVELNPEQVPVAQSQLISLARRKFKPVIVATQMLESMINSARPTRAEVTDISYAVTLGADAAMLSAESALGAFPVASVAMMDRILRQTESYIWQQGGHASGLKAEGDYPAPVWDAMANASYGLARDLMAHAIVVVSQAGRSAATVSAARPTAPVIVVSSQVQTCRKMAIMWGVIPVLVTDDEMGDHNELARKIARELNLANTGEVVLLVKGFHPEPRLNCPSVTVITV